MFVNEFMFSFSLLVFTAVLLLGGVLLLADAVRRLVRETYSQVTRKKWVRKPEIAKPSAKDPTTFNQAA